MKNKDKKVKKNTQKNTLLRKTFIRFIIELIVWTIFIPIGTMIFIRIVSIMDFQWVHDLSSEFYYGVKDRYFNITVLNKINVEIYIVWFIGVLIIIYRLIKKTFSYVNTISQAAKDLMNKELEYIELPKGFDELEKQMNQLKRDYEKSERLAKENEQRKNDLIVYLAHDLKTPLTSTIGYLSLVDEIKDMPKKQREKYISVALDKSYRLEDLINELFDIARFNSETIVLEKEEVNLNLMLEQIIDDFYPMLKENNKEIKLHTTDKILLNADPDKLARVFNNILKNAIFYSTDELISLEVKKEDQYVTITTTNKGKKISEEKLKRLFEKFYRADSSRTSKTGGSGLGLAIAKEIVELHDGEIKATSDDEFTKIYIKLPIKSLK